MVRRLALISLSVAATTLACGGKASRTPRMVPAPRPVSAPVPPPQSPPPPAVPSVAAPPSIEAFAPAPRIRVGLSTSTRALRLTSSRPFRIGAPEHLIETQDVLIAPVASAVLEGAVHRVQLRSFPTRSLAATMRSSLREELDDPLVIWREPGSGRFALRLGSYPSAAGARARLSELRELGLDEATVVREPTQTPRPRALMLRAVGQAPIQSSSLTLSVVPQGPGAWIEVDGNPYRGYLELFVNASNRFTLVNVVNLEDYLKGVVPAELSPKAFPEKEAIKAQAIAARTYAIKRLGQFEADGYDICATPACQVYRGVSAEQPMASEAVRETRGEVLTYQGRLVDALYTSTCGGRTENAENIFSSAQPYLVSRACFLEPKGNIVRSTLPAPPSLETAALVTVGMMGAEVGRRESPVNAGRAQSWLSRAVDELGQSACWSFEDELQSKMVDVVLLAQLVGEALCWERRLPFLISREDAVRIVPGDGISEQDRRYLAFAIQEDLIRPDGAGIQPGRALGRQEIFATLYRILRERGDPVLRDAQLLRIDSGRLFLHDQTLGDDDNEISTLLAPGRHLFRKAGESTYSVPELSLLPGDQVQFHMGYPGIDILVLVSEGASFDRSSRLSHWVVRNSNEALSREVNASRSIGDILDLRPKRYGRSGRIVELELVGSAGSVELDGLAVRRALGIRENLFFIDRQLGPDGAVASWVFTGRGWGHGVGMCQVGAFGMAAAGYGYREILAHYYSGTRVETRSLAQAAP